MWNSFYYFFYFLIIGYRMRFNLHRQWFDFKPHEMHHLNHIKFDTFLDQFCYNTIQFLLKICYNL